MVVGLVWCLRLRPSVYILAEIWCQRQNVCYLAFPSFLYVSVGRWQPHADRWMSINTLDHRADQASRALATSRRGYAKSGVTMHLRNNSCAKRPSHIDAPHTLTESCSRKCDMSKCWLSVSIDVVLRFTLVESTMASAVLLWQSVDLNHSSTWSVCHSRYCSRNYPSLNLSDMKSL